jgi:hypothetical protein
MLTRFGAAKALHTAGDGRVRRRTNRLLTRIDSEQHESADKEWLHARGSRKVLTTVDCDSTCL